ncbi:MAG TPA: hypothetical protein VKA46_40985 [Gemmataceae bacterium]|nr:hypothetical protein [Gemmataceae bacterium]
MTSIPVQQTPQTPPADTVEERFRRLAAAWHQVCPTHPRNPVRYDHPVYQQIVGLGAAIVPHLLRTLREYPRDWFWALHVITGADPVTPEERGSVSGLREAWLRWARERGYLLDDGGGANGNTERTAPTARPGSGPVPTLEEKFQQLAAIWRAETCYLSSTTAMVNHPAYQEIIGLGPSVVPLVLRELEQRPAQWFSALRALTGADPMDPADRGKVRKIADAWLRWGRANGYQW